MITVKGYFLRKENKLITNLRDLISEKKLSEVGVTKNELAKFTGISNTYINFILDGKIKKPGRNKIISIGVGLNCSLDEIDYLLRKDEYIEIHENDLNVFITLAKERNITGFQPVFESINHSMSLLSLDTLPGDQIVVNKNPSGALEPPEYLKFRDELRLKRINSPIYHELRKTLLLERKKYLNKLLQKYKLHYLVCYECFNRYVDRSKNSGKEKKFIIAHLKELLKYIEHPNYQFDLIDQCPPLSFELKFLPDVTHGKNKVVFIGRREHVYSNMKDSNNNARDRLYGITTDSIKFFNHFKAEYEDLAKNYIRRELTKPKNMKDHVNKIIRRLK